MKVIEENPIGSEIPLGRHLGERIGVILSLWGT
jgi:hypothetical protein